MKKYYVKTIEVRNERATIFVTSDEIRNTIEIGWDGKDLNIIQGTMRFNILTRGAKSFDVQIVDNSLT